MKNYILSLENNTRKEVINDMNNGWQKVELSPSWDFKQEKELVGVYVSKEESVGPNGSNLYHIAKADGETVGVWGSSVLDNRLAGVKLGDEVRIVYLGEEQSEKSGRTFHAFEVFSRAAKSGQVQDKVSQLSN